MFVGHYAPGAALGGNHIKLWHCFIAVQLLDILWAPLVITGIEQVRIVESFTASNHFDLHFMPYTHSLLMAIVWSIVAGLLYTFFRTRSGLKGGFIIGLLVFSHWLMDYMMHIPDLPLYFEGPKVGLGLWQNRPLSLALELGVLLLGFGIYLTNTKAKNMIGTMLPLLFLIVLTGAQLYGNFGPPPLNANIAALSALASYAIFVVLAAFMDTTRTGKHA